MRLYNDIGKTSVRSLLQDWKSDLFATRKQNLRLYLFPILVFFGLFDQVSLLFFKLEFSCWQSFSMGWGSSSVDVECSVTCFFLLVDSGLSWAFPSVYEPILESTSLSLGRNCAIRDGRLPLPHGGGFQLDLSVGEGSPGLVLLVWWPNFMTSSIIRPW